MARTPRSAVQAARVSCQHWRKNTDSARSGGLGMTVRVRATAQRITRAIDDFQLTFHLGYFCVRSRAQAFLAAPQPDPHEALVLAFELRHVLKEWGMGGRWRAPKFTTGGLPAAAAVLRDPALFPRLRRLNGISMSALQLAGARCLRTGHSSPLALQTDIVESLQHLASGLFADNTEITYPTKALMLLTGISVALDSNVRIGGCKAGLCGLRQPYGVPSTPMDLPARKIGALGYRLSECWALDRQVITRAIRNSKFPGLIDHPARFFDVVLFTQATAATPLLRWSGPPTGWYDLHW